MEFPKTLNLEAAKEYVAEQIKTQSEEWARSLCKKKIAEKKLPEVEFTETQMANYLKLADMFSDKDQRSFNKLFAKCSKEEQEDYKAVGDFKIQEGMVSNAQIAMDRQIEALEISHEVKDLIEASITAKK